VNKGFVVALADMSDALVRESPNKALCILARVVQWSLKVVSGALWRGFREGICSPDLSGGQHRTMPYCLV